MMELGAAKMVLGVNIDCGRDAGKIQISQEAQYTESVLNVLGRQRAGATPASGKELETEPLGRVEHGQSMVP